MKIQLSSFEEQKNTNNPNVSSIDLGICEERLKAQENLTENDDLIILKIDIKSDDLSTTYVQYEIYNPITNKLVSLEVCDDLQISVNVPVSLDENTKSVYSSLSHSGYNLFDLSDSFYNDICSVYTTENGTDLTLSDRKALIYDNNGNVSICQEGCRFEYYNLTTQKAKCDCSVQKEETVTDATKINFDKNDLADSFFNTLKNSNFLVLKCYKLVFSKKGQKNNKGSYLMSGITAIFIVLSFIYVINGSKKLDALISSILKLKLNYKSKAGNKSLQPLNTQKNNIKVISNLKGKFKETKNNKNKNMPLNKFKCKIKKKAF